MREKEHIRDVPRITFLLERSGGMVHIEGGL